MFQTLGDYNILERVGAGGLGEVYRARDTRRGRTVALQIVSPAIAGDASQRERLLTDARAASALSHPNIAALYEISEDQEQLFLVCEFVPGEPIGKVIAGRPLNPRRAIDLALQMADALAEAHAAGIVHRNLNAETIIVTPKDKAKILDFGLAAWTGGEPVSNGAYRSPEQALGETGDARTDIFSLGVVLFQMLTGRPPFAASSQEEMDLQIVQAQPPAPSTLNPSLPRELDPIVAKALAKSLEHRFEEAVLFSAELRTIAAILDVRSEVAEAASPRTTKSGRSYSGWLLLIAVIAILAAAGWWRWGG